MLKKTSMVLSLLSFLLLSHHVSVSSAAIPAIAPGLQLSIDGKPVQTDFEGYIVTATQTAYVPIRFVTEGLSGRVNWDKVKQQVTIYTKDHTEIVLMVGRRIAVINGKQVSMSQPPQAITPRVMVPVRFVSEVMGAKVNAFKNDDNVETIDIRW